MKLLQILAQTAIEEDSEDVQEWLHFCETAAMEAYAEAADAEYEFERKNAAEDAYLLNLPPLTSRKRVQCYIACVAVGVANKYINAQEAKAMLYLAQTAIAAFGRDISGVRGGAEKLQRSKAERSKDRTSRAKKARS